MPKPELVSVPAASPRDSTHPSVLVLTESHTKCSAILNWIASEKSVPVQAHPKNKAGDSVRFVDVEIDGNPYRVVGIASTMLEDGPTAAAVASADRVFMVASAPKGPASADIVAALVAVRPRFASAPVVTCVYPRTAELYVTEATKRLQAAKFKLRPSSADAGDFASIWRDLCVSLARAPAVPETVKPGAKADEPRPRAVPLPVTNGGTTKKTIPTKGLDMANAQESLSALMQIDGAVGGLIADYQSGMLLAKAGGGVNLEVAAAGNSEVIKSKMKTMQALGLKEAIEDILITLGTQYHVIRPLAAKPGLFLYLVLDKAKANLAMARFKVQDIEKAMTV